MKDDQPVIFFFAMRYCVFLTTDNLDWYTVDDHLAIPALREAGWGVQSISWRTQGVDWSQFDLVIIRSPWDYQDDPAGFLACLEKIDTATLLANPLPVVRWNLRKTYLLDLQSQGIPVVPTRIARQTDPDTLLGHFEGMLDDEMIIKPVVSASGHDTFRLQRRDILSQAPRIAAALAGREYLVQPFIPSILDEGEYSLFYFYGRYSHAIRKVPRPGDFRVQEEHGGLITPISPNEFMQAHAVQALSVIEESTLYARVDLVRLGDGSLAVMELELIEPALYFRMDPASPGRFAQALSTWVENHSSRI